METYAETISKFMSWAERTLAKAVEDDERFEAESGTREFVPRTRDIPCSKFLTDEEKIEILHQVNEYRRQGNKSPVAAKMAGIHQSTYNNWRRKFKIDYTK